MNQEGYLRFTEVAVIESNGVLSHIYKSETSEMHMVRTVPLVGMPTNDYFTSFEAAKKAAR
jgi:hypothetical protein